MKVRKLLYLSVYVFYLAIYNLLLPNAIYINFKTSVFSIIISSIVMFLLVTEGFMNPMFILHKKVNLRKSLNKGKIRVFKSVVFNLLIIKLFDLAFLYFTNMSTDYRTFILITLCYLSINYFLLCWTYFNQSKTGVISVGILVSYFLLIIAGGQSITVLSLINPVASIFYVKNDAVIDLLKVLGNFAWSLIVLEIIEIKSIFDFKKRGL